jgi:hypothetical protein
MGCSGLTTWSKNSIGRIYTAGWLVKLFSRRFHTNRTLQAKEFTCNLPALCKVIESGIPCPYAEAEPAAVGF